MKKFLAAGLLACAALAGTAQAEIVSGELTGGSAAATGTFVELTPPPGFTVGKDRQQSNNLFAFNEQQNVTLASAITTSLGTINAGTRVNSHYVFFDPRAARSVIGNVVFDGSILAVFSTRADESATDDLFGLSYVNYLNPPRRGLEPGDSFTIGGPARVNLSWRASSPGDYIRVITAAGAVPEPATWAMLILGFGMVGGALRRRKAPAARAFA